MIFIFPVIPILENPMDTTFLFFVKIKNPGIWFYKKWKRKEYIAHFITMPFIFHRIIEEKTWSNPCRIQKNSHNVYWGYPSTQLLVRRILKLWLIVWRIKLQKFQ